jgi:hypothetical protein
MADSEQANLHRTYFEAAQKFDYFVTGGAGTALTYAVQTYQPVQLEALHQLVPLSWLSLLAAVGMGLWHLSMRVDHARISVAHVAIGEDLSTLREARLKGAGIYMTGPDVAVRPQEMPDAIAMHESELQKIRDVMTRLNARGKWTGIARNALLFFGLAALTAWKIANLH